MIDAMERKIFQTLYDHYPEWKLTPCLVYLGQKIFTHQQKYKLDLKLLTVTKPTLADCIKASYAYARHEIIWRHELIVRANADYLFQNCYFLIYQDALNFCRAVCFLRYFIILAKRTWHDSMGLVFSNKEGHLSAYEVQIICLNVAYYDQIGTWLPSPVVTPTSEMIAMQND